jgi:spermidine synthase
VNLGRCTSLAAFLIGFVACIFSAASYAQSMKLVHSERSLYREVLVYEGRGERCMCFTRDCRVGRQSCMSIKHPERIVMNYPQMMLGALFVKPQPKSILIIGLGGGTIPQTLARFAPNARIEVVEIDPAVIRVAKQYFRFAESSNVRAIPMDGRVYVKQSLRAQRKYDMVMLDAFDHEYIPEHLLTKEFIREVQKLLAPNGVLVANTFSSSRLYDHESVTYAAVFPTFFNLKRDNRIIIAINGALPTEESLRVNSRRLEADFREIGIDTSHLLALFTTRPDWKRDARVLTDQYSPANLLNLDRE